MYLWAPLSLILSLLPLAAQALTCHNTRYKDISYTICDVDMQIDDLRLFLRAQDGTIYGQFSAIERGLGQDQTLAFAMNAGMYHADRSPVGLYSEGASQEQRLITSEGPGNFGLLPNGVFCIGHTRVDVIETKRFAQHTPTCRFTSQSGPMLVIDGALHPRFFKDSTSRFIRNGVGTTKDGTHAMFVISNEPVTFHNFGSLFRDHLQLPQALYFDGKVSRIHTPSLNRSDSGFWLGPIVGVIQTQ